MNNLDLISETIASQLAGVSPTTLSRFVEAGYLRVSNNQGTKNYVKSEICSLFAVDAEQAAAVEADAPASVDNQESDLISAVEIVNEDESPSEQQSSSDTEEEKVYWAETLEPNASQEEAPSTQSASDQSELVRLRNISEMQDKILEMREREIEDLRKERDWLRTRVERLEEKSERDQLLLLAETQTIKRLVNITQAKKPSGLRAALEWIGIVPPTPPSKEVQTSNSKVIE